MQSLLPQPVKNMNDNNKPHTEKITVKTGLKSRTINVDYLARVEGEGALFIQIAQDKVQDVKLKIFEPPRFFEAFLRGRSYLEAPDITSRICGICPVAYQMSAVTAMENALKISIPEDINAFRRLLYCGEWIESHVLHIYMLHAPDFLGFADAIQMAKKFPEIVKDGLFLKKCGNQIVKVLGGREIHPINVRIGGFYHLPTQKELLALKAQLILAREKAIAAVKWLATLTYPDYTLSCEYVSLMHAQDYPMFEGKIISSQGLDIPIDAFEAHFEEFQVPHSTALHCKIKARANYLVGPLARYNLNRDKLSGLTLQVADAVGFETLCVNPFRSILVRSLEVLYAFDEAIRILENYHSLKTPYIEAPIVPGTGYGLTEAPRGALYHRYQIDEQGIISSAKIVAPTSQNQYTIEKDLYQFVTQNYHLPQEQLTWRCEQTIRNYDPCISCSTHFLKLHYQHVNAK